MSEWQRVEAEAQAAWDELQWSFHPTEVMERFARRAMAHGVRRGADFGDDHACACLGRKAAGGFADAIEAGEIDP